MRQERRVTNASYDSQFGRMQLTPTQPQSPTSQLTPLPNPCICIFTHQPNGEMYISVSGARPSPLYIVTVHMNCLIPTSYVTTVRRGDSPGNDSQGIVAQFE